MATQIVPRPAGKEPGTRLVRVVGDPGWIIVGVFLIGCIIIWWFNGY